MAKTLTDYQNMKDALETALGNGVLMVRYTDRVVTYHSIADIEKAIGYVDRQMAKIANAGKPSSTRASFRRGY